MEAEKSRDGKLARLAVWVGILAGIAAIVGVLYTIFNQPNNDVPNYQKAVVATCDNVRTVLTTGHMEILASPSFGVGFPDLRARKEPYIAILRSNLDQARVAFDALNIRSVPPSLTGYAEAAKEAQQAWFVASEQVIAGFASEPGDTVSALRMGQEFAGNLAAAQLDTAMTDLAGTTCNVTRPTQP